MDDDPSSESIEPLEMPETANKTLTQVVVTAAGTIVVAAILACAGGYVSTNSHLTKIDTILDNQTEILKNLPTKLDNLATTPVVEKRFGEMETRLSDQQKQLNACREEKATIERSMQERYNALSKLIDANTATLQSRTASRWSALEMDRWISLAKDKLGKPLPTVTDVTGHSPLYDPQSNPVTP